MTAVAVEFYPTLAAAQDDVGAASWATLNVTERLFVAHLLADPQMEALRAARRAGCSEKDTGAGTKLLKRPHVRAAVDAAIEARMARLRVQGDRILREVDTVSLSSLAHYVVDPLTGNVTLAPGAPPDAMRAIASIRRRVRRFKPKRGKAYDVFDVEIKLWDKTGANRLSMQHRGMLEAPELPPGDPDEQARKIRAQLDAMDATTGGKA